MMDRIMIKPILKSDLKKQELSSGRTNHFNNNQHVNKGSGDGDDFMASTTSK